MSKKTSDTQEIPWVLDPADLQHYLYPGWKSLNRKKDKVAVVGFSPTTRDQTPWFDPDYDIWTLNEEYTFDWVKRNPDLHFQMHPRWDWSRDNNMNHYNHPQWLMNKSGVCMKCKGSGIIGVDDAEKKTTANPCEECRATGTYAPPPYRTTLPVIMQEHWDDIPNSIPFPLKEATDLLPLGGYPYFTSSVAFMLSLAWLMGYAEVHLFGFEMGTTTEYHYQRANFEYLVGFFQAKGMKIIIPDTSSLLKGELYGYKNMKTGFRQNLEMRSQFLDIQEVQQREIFNKLSGAVEKIQEMMNNGHPELAKELNEMMPLYAKAIGTHNVIKGAIAEVKNLTKLYDSYFKGGADGDNTKMTAEEFNQFINAAYTQ
jgi:hypothetical protein